MYVSTADLETTRSENCRDYKRNMKSRKQIQETKKNKSGTKFDTTGTDPREGCCWQGEAFMNALKAMITRLIFLFHSMIVVWRVTEVKGDLFWLFSIPYLALIVEAMIVLLFRRVKEWKW